MHLILRNLVMCLTACTFVCVSLAVGHARGQAPVAGQIVICHGLTMITIDVDGEGQPTTAHQTCPDGVLHFADTRSAGLSPSLADFEVSQDWDAVETRITPKPIALGHRSRAPPGLLG